MALSEILISLEMSPNGKINKEINRRNLTENLHKFTHLPRDDIGRNSCACIGFHSNVSGRYRLTSAVLDSHRKVASQQLAERLKMCANDNINTTSMHTVADNLFHPFMIQLGTRLNEKTQLKTNLKLNVLQHTKWRHFWAQIVSWAPRHAWKCL